jgi:hypothetical protein
MIIFKTSFVLILSIVSVSAFGEKVEVSWDKVEAVNKTIPTLQVVVNPPLRPGSAIGEKAYAEVKRLGADYVRYVPWLPYPKLAVAELEPPADGKTSWDFSLIDPMTEDFLRATSGHSVIVNFSTTPQWMWVTPKPVAYPSDPDGVTWTYTQGTELRDPSGKELGDYYGRLVSWYVNGGFTDEYGKRRESGHHFKIPYWEVLNEVDFEHKMTPETYVLCYDSIVSAIKAVAPQMKFVGLALAGPSDNPRMFEYFLNPANHKPGIPLDMISYHFYATPSVDQTLEVEQFTFFEQADHFLTTVRYVEEIRKRLSPSTRTTIDEIGSISADDMGQDKPGHVTAPIPGSYWSLSGATYAYVFGRLAKLGIDAAGESQLIGYPTQFPSVSMVDWNTGSANPRLQVLALLKHNFSVGDKLVSTSTDSPAVFALGFISENGKHKLLLVNKRDHSIELSLPQIAKDVEFVDETTQSHPPVVREVNESKYQLGALGVAVLTLQP